MSQEEVCVFPQLPLRENETDTRQFQNGEILCIRNQFRGLDRVSYLRPIVNQDQTITHHIVQNVGWPGSQRGVFWTDIGKLYKSMSPSALKKVLENEKTPYIPSNVESVLRQFGGRERKQKGGYSFLIYDGIRNAGLLMPLVARQGWRLLSNSNTRRKNKKRQLVKKRKTRKNRS